MNANEETRIKIIEDKIAFLKKYTDRDNYNLIVAKTICDGISKEINQLLKYINKERKW